MTTKKNLFLQLLIASLFLYLKIKWSKWKRNDAHFFYDKRMITEGYHWGLQDPDLTRDPYLLIGSDQYPDISFQFMIRICSGQLDPIFL